MRTSRGPVRVMFALNLMLIFFNVVSIAAATAFLPRYTSHVSPLYVVFSSLTLFACVTVLFEAVRRLGLIPSRLIVGVKSRLRPTSV